jgi:mono/diheme cytochrome c family protein
MTEAQRSMLGELKNAVKLGGKFYVDQQYPESAEQIESAQEILEILAADADADLLEALKPFHRRIVKAHQLLSEKGETLSPRAELNLEPDDTEAVADAAGDAVGDGAPDQKLVSFSKQVAPILVKNCGGCHVRETKGDFSMASYQALMKGGPNGPAVVPHDLSAGSLIALVESGDMPPMDREVKPRDLNILKDWIEQGAAFDGKSKSAELTSFVSGSAKGRRVRR